MHRMDLGVRDGHHEADDRDMYWRALDLFARITLKVSETSAEQIPRCW